MSRIGRLPIPSPRRRGHPRRPGRDREGPKGTLSHTVPAPITIERADDGTLLVAVRTTSARAAACTA
jgi:large subunit ribosomal protein L6